MPAAVGLDRYAELPYPATLIGLGERVHLARPDVDLDTHIADVVNLLEYEDLGDVVLVGHSYAGAVITGVADRSADRLPQLVYLDTAPFEDGETVLEFNPPDEQERMTRQVDGEGDGWRLAFPDSLEQLGPPDIPAHAVVPEGTGRPARWGQPRRQVAVTPPVRSRP